ncbi:glycerate kinase [Clostridium tagluense]|uniref:glycerate kinase n=1 Tax=Clostridium tagluense TaxID=360422 RepID=UPI001C0D4F67|nr:glycerate kinase [Clostridium tagluense]MBU3128220.1 glycerate kinase [Clostridium tagluense]MCB2314061.1 glycerate kinase [Clostridium tagluense]MCB2318891.1 glycerate kinase [Clostridium tagluense]MCB2323793.1 glycerate kinase [Clostridium tagluense]MCB2328612.1 glycerate kinase [Clostridium tagluense]
MKFLLAPDSFKESMTAKEAADAMERGIRKVIPYAECIKVPMADGGEGTVQSLVDATEGELYKVLVKGPLGDEVEATFGVLGDKKTAVIEMASASGLHLVPRGKRNPLLTTTYGTGQLIKAALDKGVNHLIIGIGGSATNDGGAGMIQALGGKLLTLDNEEINLGGGYLNLLHKIDLDGLDKRLKGTTIEVACDVTSPLTGKNGASYVFGPQKGATLEMVKILDDNLSHYAKIIKQQLGMDIESIPGAGAAGGLGAGLLAFFRAELKRGIELVTEHTKLKEKMQYTDYVFTGEGSIDAQTLYGKTPLGVALIAKEYNIPVIAFAGRIGDGVEALYEHGINSIIGILSEADTIEKALKKGPENIERTCENIARIILLNK